MIKKFIFSHILIVASLLTTNVSASEKEIQQLFVKGEATLFKPADQMHLAVGVVTQDQDPQKALQANNIKIDQLIQNLVSIGLTKAEYQTGQFSIQPIYSTPPKEIPPDWRQVISHYEVNNTLQIKTQRLDLAGKIIQVAAQAGSNQIDSIQFDLKNPRLYRAEAIEVATQNAIADAQVLAKAANVELLNVSSLVLDPSRDSFPVPRHMNFAYAADKSSLSTTSIEAGEIEVKASVDMTFEIGSIKR